MAKREPKPSVEWDELYSSTDFRELFRYRKEKRTRTYHLRVLDNGDAELWVNSEGGREARSRRLMTLTNPEEAVPALESIEQELRAGGWSQV